MRFEMDGRPANTETMWNRRNALRSVGLPHLLEIATDFNRRNKEILGKTVDTPGDLEVRHLSNDRFRRNQRHHIFDKLETVIGGRFCLVSTISPFCEESWPHLNFAR
jgi:hypothetical protein